jgi:chorismate mutase
MTEQILPPEPSPSSPAVRELINCDPLTDYETLEEIRSEIDALDDQFFPLLAAYLDRRTILTDDAVRFKASPDQVVAIERQESKLREIDERATREVHRSTALIVDVFDAMITGSVNRQKELFNRTSPIHKEQT